MAVARTVIKLVTELRVLAASIGTKASAMESDSPALVAVELAVRDSLLLLRSAREGLEQETRPRTGRGESRRRQIHEPFAAYAGPTDDGT